MTKYKTYIGRLALFLSLLCLAFISNAQVYQTYPQYGMEVKRINPTILQGLPSDTFPIPAELQSKVHLAHKGDSLYKWSTTQLIWVPLNIGTGLPSNICRNQLLTEWSVSWQGSGYNFSVHGGLSDGTGSYQIGCDFYTADSLTVTLDPADDDKERIDVIYLDATGVHVLKGDTAVVGLALKPQVELDQIELSIVTVSPATTEPTLNQFIVYDENTGESNVTNVGTTTDPNNATNVFIGTKSLNVTNINDPTGGTADFVYFTKPTGSWNVLGFDGFTFSILLKEIMSASANLAIRLEVGTTAVSTEVTIPLVKTNITTYQQITIPITAFGNITNSEITRVRIRYVRAGNTATYTGFYFDYAYFVDGFSQPTSPGTAQFTFNPPVGFQVSPSNTQTSPGTWTMSATPGSYGSLDNFYSPDGWQSLPQILSSIGTLDGRAKTANGAEVDEEEIFLQTVDATYPGLATPDMYDKIYNQIYQQYYLQNVGDGDSLAIPINDTVTGIKSLKEGTGITFDITDSTITINSSGGGITQEQSEDFTGAMFATDNGDIDFTYNDGTPDIAATIKNDAVTYAKIQNVSAASKLLGRGDSGSGDVQEITLGAGLTMTGTTLSSTGGATPGIDDVLDVAQDLTANRSIVLGGHSLKIFNGANELASITENTTTLLNYNGSNFGGFNNSMTSTTAQSQIIAFYDGGTKTAAVTAVANQFAAKLIVDADTVNINGINSIAADTTAFKPLVINSSGLVQKSHWGTFGGGGGSYTDEQAQDAIGTMINASLQYVDGTPLLAIGDRDFGDITTSGSGLTMTIDNLAVTNAKINDVAWSKVTGTPTTLSGYGITDALSNSTTSTQDGYFGTIKLRDVTNPSHYLTIRNNEDLTAAHTLNIITGDADRTLTLTGNATISGTNTGDQTSVTGNAGTATALQTARNIQGVAFDGTANIDPINGTGFVKATGTTLSYDNSTYVTGNIYTTDGTLAGNRAIALNGNTLNVNQGSNSFLSIDPTAGFETSLFRAYNTTGSDNSAFLSATTTNADAQYSLSAVFNGGAGTASIGAAANTTASSLTYTANTHQFTGNVGIGVSPIVLFEVESGGEGLVNIDPSNFRSILRASDGTGFSRLVLQGDVTGVDVRFILSSDDNVNTVSIEGDGVANTITHTAGSHTFTGPLVLNGSASGTVTLNSDALSNAPNATTLSGTGYVPARMFSRLTSDFTMSDVNTVQPVFGTGQDVWTLQASTSYYFEGVYHFTHGAASHSVGMSFELAGGASVTSIYYYTITSVAAANTPTASQTNDYVDIATNEDVNFAGANAVEVIRFWGWINMNAGGTVTPSVTFSAAPGGTVLAKAGTYITFTPVGTNTVAQLGNVN